MDIEDFVKGKHNELILGKWGTDPVDLGFNLTDDKVWEEYFGRIKKVWINLSIIEQMRFFLADGINNLDSEQESEHITLFFNLFRLMLDGLNKEETLSKNIPIPNENSFAEFLQNNLGIEISKEWIINCSGKDDIALCKKVELLQDKFEIGKLKTPLDNVLSTQTYIDLDFPDSEKLVKERVTTPQKIWDIWTELITELSNLLVWVSPQTTFLSTIRWITRTYLERCYPIFAEVDKLDWLVNKFGMESTELPKLSGELKEKYLIFSYLPAHVGNSIIELENQTRTYLVDNQIIQLEKTHELKGYIRGKINDLSKLRYPIEVGSFTNYSNSGKTKWNIKGIEWSLENLRISGRDYKGFNDEFDTFFYYVPIHQLLESLSPFVFIGWCTPIKKDEGFWIKNY